jgi:hypothetical protein
VDSSPVRWCSGTATCLTAQLFVRDCSIAPNLVIDFSVLLLLTVMAEVVLVLLVLAILELGLELVLIVALFDWYCLSVLCFRFSAVSEVIRVRLMCSASPRTVMTVPQSTMLLSVAYFTRHNSKCKSAWRRTFVAGAVKFTCLSLLFLLLLDIVALLIELPSPNLLMWHGSAFISAINTLHV